VDQGVVYKGPVCLAPPFIGARETLVIARLFCRGASSGVVLSCRGALPSFPAGAQAMRSLASVAPRSTPLRRGATAFRWTDVLCLPVACEALPYPYGFVRSDQVCLIDRPYRPYRESEFADRASETALVALDRIFHGEASGSRPTCRSPFGVYDLTGNVDEWSSSTASGGNRSILKGGYWGQVRARCRPSTRVHGEGFPYYPQGFRCCADWPRP
jgi:hypothetical protein